MLAGCHAGALSRTTKLPRRWKSGRLVSWTVIRVPPARYAADAPYAVGLLELVEGPRITARVEGDPDHLAAGQPMGLVTLDPARGPIFR